MKKRTTIETVVTAEGKQVSLREHDGDYTIWLDNGALMSTRQFESEEKLAVLACRHLKGKRGARVLIGGLGFGFTLRAALAELDADAEAVVAEILPAVIAWNRNPALPLAHETLADPRVKIMADDVNKVISREHAGFDSIMLDVDNGPDALSTDVNVRLYQQAGLKRVKKALRPEGCLAIWSAAPDPVFEKLFAAAGFKVEVHSCRSRPGAGRWHTIFVGRALGFGE